MSIEFRIARPFSQWRLKPVAGEPSYSYFARLVVDEGNDSLRVYANEIGLNGRVINPEELLDALCTLPIDDSYKEMLRSYTPIAQSQYWRLGGELVRSKQLSFERRRFCPHCLSDAPYHRVWWDLVDFRTCEVHGTQLIEMVGDERLKWWWPFFDTSPLGDIIAYPQKEAAKAEGRERAGAAHLHRLIALRLATRSRDGDSFAEYELFDIIQASLFLGRWLKSSVPTPQLVSSADDLEFGFSILCLEKAQLTERMRQWFIDFVPEQLRMIGLFRSLGHVSTYWAHRPDSRLGKVIDDAMTDAFASVGRLGRRYTNRRPTARSEMTLIEAARALNVKPRPLSKLAQKMGLLPNAKWNGDALSIDPVAFSRLEAVIKDFIPSTETREVSGLPGHEFRQLIKAGLIDDFSGFALEGRKGIRVRRSDIIGIITTITGGVPHFPGTDMISMFSYAKRLGISQGELAIRLARGEVRPDAVDTARPGFRSLYFYDPKKPEPGPDLEEIEAIPDVGADRDTLWGLFRKELSDRCPVIRTTQDFPFEQSIFTSNRKLVFRVTALDAESFQLLLELHPVRTARRWKIYVSNPEGVQEAAKGRWRKTSDGAGWEVALDVDTLRSAAAAAQSMAALKRILA